LIPNQGEHGERLHEEERAEYGAGYESLKGGRVTHEEEPGEEQGRPIDDGASAGAGAEDVVPHDTP
jgi:hypothetical protein